MAKPEVEDGYTAIANEILEALCRVDLSPHESRILWFIFRKTYGFKKKMDWIALSQFSKSTGIERRRVWRALQRLLSRKLIVASKDDRHRPTYGFQKDYSQWKLSSRKATVIRTDDRVSSVRGTQLSSVKAPTKETLTKETLTKETSPTNGHATPPSEDSFEMFWRAYPKRKSKGKAERAWQKLTPSKDLLETILRAIEAQKKSRDRAQHSRLFIPNWQHPATWINAKGWEDDLDPVLPIDMDGHSRSAPPRGTQEIPLP